MVLEEKIKTCIVIPVYNEGAVIETNLGEILRYAREVPWMVQIVAVNDSSKDDSGDKIRAFSKKTGGSLIHYIEHQNNKGYGGALRTGGEYAVKAGFDYILFMDSDLTNHPKYLELFYKKMLENWDYIKATRYVKGAGTINVPFNRKIISLLGNRFARFVTKAPITDITNGFRAVKTDIFKKIELSEDHFAVIVEEFMKVSKITDRISEVPNFLGSRERAAGKGNFKYDFKTYGKYLKYLFRY